MNEMNMHFKRTLTLLDVLGFKVDKVMNNIFDFEKEIDLLLFNAKLKDKGHLGDLKEIYLIEKEKLRLKSTYEEIEKIFKEEKTIHQSREDLMRLEFNALKKKRLVKNEYTYTFQSNKNWSFREVEPRRNVFAQILKSKPSDCFFTFQQTGIYDSVLQSNVLELPISEYQYFLLELFEEPITVENVTDIFQQEFEVTNKEEMNQLYMITVKIIRQLIFRTFIVEFEES